VSNERHTHDAARRRFVGLVGTAADPAPGLAAFSDLANSTTFISANNTVTVAQLQRGEQRPALGRQAARLRAASRRHD
jgi:hypothetical protein